MGRETDFRSRFFKDAGALLRQRSPMAMELPGGFNVFRELSHSIAPEGQWRGSSPDATDPNHGSVGLGSETNLNDSSTFSATNESLRERERTEFRWAGSALTAASTGVVVSADGLIVANAQSIPAATGEVDVFFRDGGRRNARVVGRDEATNLLLLKVSDVRAPLPFVPFANLNCRAGEWVVRVEALGDQVVSSPMFVSSAVDSAMRSASEGIETSLAYPEFQRVQPTTMDYALGPVFNSRGEIAGLIVVRGPGRRPATLMLPATGLKRAVHTLREMGEIPRGYLGVLVQTIDSGTAQALGLAAEQGVLVNRVSPQSPAERAGIRSGDAILDVNGTAVRSAEDFVRKIKSRAPRERIRISMWRDGQTRRTELPLGAAKAAVAPKVDRRELTAFDSLGLAFRLNRPGHSKNDVAGARVIAVQPASIGHLRGIRAGDLIKSVQRESVGDWRGFRRAISVARDQGLRAILVEVERRNSSWVFALPLPRP